MDENTANMMMMQQMIQQTVQQTMQQAMTTMRQETVQHVEQAMAQVRAETLTIQQAAAQQQAAAAVQQQAAAAAVGQQQPIGLTIEHFGRLPMYDGSPAQYPAWRAAVVQQTRELPTRVRVQKVLASLTGRAREHMAVYGDWNPADEYAMMANLDRVFQSNATDRHRLVLFQKNVVFKTTMQQFIDDFLHEYSAGPVPYQTAVAIFCNGLEAGGYHAVAQSLEDQAVNNLADFIWAAKRYAPQVDGRKWGSMPVGDHMQVAAVNRGRGQDRGGAQGMTCFKCGRPGHMKRDCPHAAGAGASTRPAGNCFECGRPGHIARNCRNKGRKPRIFGVTAEGSGDGAGEGGDIYDPYGDGTGKEINARDCYPLSSSQPEWCSIVLTNAHPHNCTFMGTVGTRRGDTRTAKVLIDSGATKSMVSVELSKWLNREKKSGPRTTFQFANGTMYQSNEFCPRAPLTIQDYKAEVDLLVCQLAGVDVVLGRDWLERENPKVDWRTGVVELQGDNQAMVTSISTQPQQQQQQQRRGDCGVVSAPQMKRLLKNPGMLEAVATVIPRPTKAEKTIATLTQSNDGRITAHPALQDIIRQYDDLFAEPKSLPTHRPGFEHRIVLQPDSQPPYRNYIRMGPQEAQEMASQLEKLLSKDAIVASAAPYAAPALFVRKKDGSLRMCIDYRGLNKITVRDRYPLPNISDLLDRVGSGRIFSKMDLRAGFHQIRMAKEDIDKTAFITHMGQFAWKVMPMGLTNAPATFQRLMNSVLTPLRGFAVVYLDDILVFSATVQEHAKHLQAVLAALKKAGLYVHAGKSEFGVEEVMFLGHVIGRGVIGMDKSKVSAIKEWSLPRTKAQLQSFLGFTNYYRTHVYNYAHIAAPLSDLLTQGSGVLQYTKEATKAFEDLKKAMTEAPVLHSVDSSAAKTVYTDASDVAVGAVLHQHTQNGEVPVAYYSRKMTPTEQRYPARDKELLGLVSAVKHWRHHLMGRKFTVYSDHESLQYWTTMDVSAEKGRLARWIEELAYYDMEVKYIKGKHNIADALSREPLIDKVEVKATTEVTGATVVSGTDGGAIAKDAYYGPVVEALQGDSSISDGGVVTHRAARFKLMDGRLYLTGLDVHNNETLRLCVAGHANQQRLIREFHNSEAAGHPGIDRTLDAISKHYFWPHMKRSIKKHVMECESCQRTKGDTTSHGMQPIPVPPGPGHTVSIDFLEMPLSMQGNNYLLVVVDKFTKMVRVKATTKAVTGPEAADMVLEIVLPVFGRMPAAIISDRDPRFTSDLWQQLWKSMDVQLKMTTAHRPQADGQTERANRQVLEHLRHYCNNQGSDWDTPKRLAMMEFAINSHTSETTGMCAFEALLGRAPIPPAVVGQPGAERAAQHPITAAQHEARARDVRDASEAAGDRMVRANQPGRVSSFELVAGDKVWLHSRNYPQHHPHKLTGKYLGPFRVVEVLSKHTVRLDLPDAFHDAHNVINTDQIKPYVPKTPTHTEEEEEEEEDGIDKHEDGKVQTQHDVINNTQHTIKKIVQQRGEKFLVQWDGEGPENNYWLTKAQLQQQCPPHVLHRLLAALREETGRGKRRSNRLRTQRGE